MYAFGGEGKEGRGRERGTEDLKRALRTEPDLELELTNCETMTRAQVECSTDCTTQVPLLLF